MFIRTHAYFLRHMYADRIFKWLDPYVDAVVTLDENNREVYYWAATVVRYGQIIDEAVIERSNKFAEMGIKRFADDARLYAHLGFNKYFEIRPLRIAREQELTALIDKEKDHDKRQALLAQLAEVRADRYGLEREALFDYTLSAMLPNSSIDPVFLATLYIKHDEVGAATRVIASLYSSASDDDKQQLLYKLKDLGRDQLAAQLREESDKHLKEKPYIPSGLFRLVGSSENLRVPENWDKTGDVLSQAMQALEESEQNEVIAP